LTGSVVRVALMDHPGDVKARLFTVAYRKVLETEGTSVPLDDLSGRFGLTLGLDDDKGRALADGLYFMVIETEGVKKTLKLLVAR
jgi:hypothetical protein